MKQSFSLSSEEPAKPRKVKHETHHKLMTQNDCVYQTLIWLDCDMQVEAGVKVVIMMKYNTSIKKLEAEL